MSGVAVFDYPYPPLIEYVTPDNEFEGMYRVSAKILLTGYELDYESQQFLADNPDIPFELPRIAEIVQSIVKDHIIPTFDVIMDEEAMNVRRLAINFVIRDKKYEEVLNIWTEISKKVYSQMSTETAKKIAILVDSG